MVEEWLFCLKKKREVSGERGHLGQFLVWEKALGACHARLSIFFK